MEIYFMDRRNAITSAYMPQAIGRVIRFCERFDTDTKGPDLAHQLWMLYGSGDRRLGLWIVVKDFVVIGHLLAHPEPIERPGGPWDYVLIRQAEADPKIDTRAESVIVFDAVKTWATGLGVPRLRMLTHRKADLMAKRWGFVEYKTLMQREL